MSRFTHLEFDGESEDQSWGQKGVVKDEAYYSAEARTAFENGNFESGLRLYSKVLEFNPNNVAAWGGQVRMLIELGEFREARLWADKALERFPHEPELLAAKAVALGINALLVLNSTPAGAQILIDGKTTGRVTPAQFAVEKGGHTILLRKQGFLDETTVATALAVSSRWENSSRTGQVRSMGLLAVRDGAPPHESAGRRHTRCRALLRVSSQRQCRSR